MEKINAVIIDDEQNNIDFLELMIQKYCSSFINIIGKSKTIIKGVDLINSLKPKLLFLDIKLNNGTSFDILDKIDNYNYKVIFVTAYDKFAIKAFKYRAIDYLLKPLEPEAMLIAINNACEEINNEFFTNKIQLENLDNQIKNNSTKLDFIAIPSIDKIEFIKIKEIIYLQSDGKYTFFYLNEQKKIVSSKNLGIYENLLDPDQFFRIHNTYIVNLSKVVSINKASGNYCEMINGKALPIAKRRQDQLNKYIKIK